jgi:hypothetical protein
MNRRRPRGQNYQVFLPSNPTLSLRDPRRAGKGCWAYPVVGPGAQCLSAELGRHGQPAEVYVSPLRQEKNGVVVEHFLKVECNTQYVSYAHRSVDAGRLTPVK